MKKITVASLAIQPAVASNDELALIDGGAPPASGGLGRNQGYNGSRPNEPVYASQTWRSQPENQPAAGFGTFTGTPASPRPQKPPHYIDTNRMEEQAGLPPWNVV